MLSSFGRQSVEVIPGEGQATGLSGQLLTVAQSQKAHVRPRAPSADLSKAASGERSWPLEHMLREALGERSEQLKTGGELANTASSVQEEVLAAYGESRTPGE